MNKRKKWKDRESKQWLHRVKGRQSYWYFGLLFLLHCEGTEHTCEPVSILCRGVAVNAFQNRICLTSYHITWMCTFMSIIMFMFTFMFMLLIMCDINIQWQYLILCKWTILKKSKSSWNVIQYNDVWGKSRWELRNIMAEWKNRKENRWGINCQYRVKPEEW